MGDVIGKLGSHSPECKVGAELLSMGAFYPGFLATWR